MKLFFKGAILDSDDSSKSIQIQSNWKRPWHTVCILPGNTRIYGTSDYNRASRFVAEVQKAFKKGISCGAEWIDCSGLPGSVETGIVVLRGED